MAAGHAAIYGEDDGSDVGNGPDEQFVGIQYCFDAAPTESTSEAVV